MGKAENTEEKEQHRYREQSEPNATYHGPILRWDSIESQARRARPGLRLMPPQTRRNWCGAGEHEPLFRVEWRMLLTSESIEEENIG